MKRWILWTSVLIIILAASLSRTAMEPDRFTGIWHSVDGKQYLFQEGIITGGELTDSSADRMDGAYAFTRDTITLFVADTKELDTVRTLYWIPEKEGDILCEDPQGIGTVYFYRSID